VIEERVHRRLAAILAADIVGYSRLMEADEAGTLTRLKALWTELLEPTIGRYNGRVFKTTGDGVLVEFSSAVDAVCCSVSIQTEMRSRPVSDLDETALRYRIGVHLGDVVIEGDDIFGDGVNIAARLEGLAPVGGVAISGSMQEHVAGKVEAAFTDAGDQKVKNISRPVRVWLWQPGGTELPALAAPRKAVTTAGHNPLVAVMRFSFRGGDAEIADFAESLADDLTTAFARRRGIEVVARSSTAKLNAASGGAPSVRAATQADYVLTGGLQRSGSRIRVTAELVDAVSGGQLWTDRYDRDWGDPFALLDDLTEHIAYAARTAMNAYDGRRFDDGSTRAVTNAERRAKAAEHFYKFTKADYLAAERLLDDVLENDPDDAMALAMRAFCLFYLGSLDVHDFDSTTRDRILAMAGRAVECDRNSDYAYQFRGVAKLHLLRDHDAALADAERALAISPQYGLALHLKAEAFVFGGREAEGITLLRRIIEMNARDPINYYRSSTIALGHYAAGEHEAALAAIEFALSGAMGIPRDELIKAAILVELGRVDDAQRTMEAVRSRWPDSAISNIRTPPYKSAETGARYVDALRAAGLPDDTPADFPES
jgi:adenylate cyclase